MKYTVVKDLLKSDWLITILLGLYLIAVSGLVLNRWWQYENFYFDHGIFDQSLWNVSRGKAPIFDHIDNPALHQLGDHFNPTLYLLAPVYWMTDRYEVLLVLGVVAVVMASWVMYHLTKKLVKSPLMRVVLVVAFLDFVGLQNGLIAGFHPELLALATGALALWFYEQSQWRKFWIMALLTVGLKEVLVGMFFALGMMCLWEKKNKKIGWALIATSLIYGWVVTQMVIPYFSGGAYAYGPKVELVDLLLGWFNHPEKVKTFLVSMTQFGWLPVFSPGAWLLPLQDFFLRMVVGKPAAWDLGMHYSLMSSLFLYYAALKGVGRVEYSGYSKVITGYAIVVLLVGMGFHLRLNGPLGLIANPVFYRQTANSDFLDDFLTVIPTQGKLMTQNNLAVKLTHSHDLMLLRDDYWEFMPETIAIDIREGQNPNNYWPGHSRLIYDRLVSDPHYARMPYTEEQVVFVRIKGDMDKRYYEQFEKPEDN